MTPIDNEHLEKLKTNVIDILVEGLGKRTLSNINDIEDDKTRNIVFSKYTNTMMIIFLNHFFESESIKNDENAKIALAQDFINAILIEFNFQCKIEKVNNE